MPASPAHPARAASPWGLPVALGVLAAWGAHLAYLLVAGPAPAGVGGALALAGHVALQAFLCTGLFITGHDAMHGTVHPRAWVNRAVGTAACFLFAGLSYRRLVVNHRAHHAAPTGPDDPDFCQASQGFWRWFGTFMVRYTTLVQLLVMAAKFNALVWLGVEQWRVWAYWVVPSVLGTLQLFYFGTYLPHRRPSTADMAPHHARTLPRGHAWAFLSCYFFGYHWEHHESPGTPWWALWRKRDARAGVATAAAEGAR